MQFWEWLGKALLVSVVAGVTVRTHYELCTFTSQGFANCSALRLRHIPLDLASTIVSLDVSNNQLTSIEWPLPYFHLVHLNLSRNHIQSISYHSFIHLYSLNLLDLSFNNIKYLSRLDSNYTFFYTSQLVHLILRGNPIISLGSNPIKSDSLKKLDLAECDVRSLEGETSLAHMPSLISLVLDRNPLKVIDVLKSDKLEELYLEETQLLYIQPEFYKGLPRLEVLDLSKNYYLTSLTRVGIASSPSLMILKAEFCSLEYLQLQGFPRLERLYLRGNRIGRINPGDFVFNEKLLVVDLSMNWIHRVEPKGFIGATTLAWMDLSENKISDLRNSLSALHRLTHLNISSNPLTTIEGVEVASHLTILDASHCQISYLPRGFLSLGHLEAVNLSNNIIWTLPPEMSSFTLIDLNLGYNRLAEVDNTWFKHFPRLKRLNLDGNRLTEPFHPDTLTRLEHVALYLHDNPWRCNCGEIRYRNFYKHLSAKGNSHSLTCRGPENVTGLSWKSACFSIDAEASVKRDGKKNAWLPMLISALVTLGIILLLYLLKRRSGHVSSDVETVRDVPTAVQSTPRSPPREESRLPSYEEALLMPKPNVATKSNADTQTHASFLGSVRSLDTRSKHGLVHSPSSNSL